MGYLISSFRDFENYLRIVVALDGDDIQLLLEQYKMNFGTYELSPGIYTIKDNSENVYTMSDHWGTLQIENNDISLKTKLKSIRFRGIFGTLRFLEKSFLYTLLGFIPNCDYEPTNKIQAENPGYYTKDKFTILSTLEKIHLICDITEGSALNGFRQRVLFSFISD